INLHRFWNRHAHAAPFSYFIGKFGGHDRKKFLSVPWAHHRLAMAAAQLVDAAFTSFYTPEPEPGEVVGLWDEMVGGTARRTGWLGQPLGPPVHLAHRAPDLLNGAGAAWSADLVARFQGQGIAFAANGVQLGVTSRDGAARLNFRLEDVPCIPGEDLLLAVKLKAAPRPEYPPATPRLLRVETDAKDQPAIECFVGSEWFETTLYFRALPSDRVTLRFTLEGGGPLWLSELRVHAHPDVAFRLFEKGIVLANPGDRPFTFDLAGLQPARRYRRIRGSPRQDPPTNNGTPVDGTVTLAMRDGLFLVVDGIRPGG
ncbi:MAG: hypothetical protein KJ579_11440, partial [Verrucomicrobia bacterium]|nr:hypothetical protein [Verrucomicrobiota bacterium]